MAFPQLVKRAVITLMVTAALPCPCVLSQNSPVAAFRIVQKVVVDAELDPDADNPNPGVVRCKNGDLLIEFCSLGRLYTTRSRDNGHTWQKPIEIATGGLDSAVGMIALRDGTILLPFIHNMVKYPCCEDRRVAAYIYRSTDNGVTWQGDAPVDSPLRETVAYGHILELPDGRLLFPFWGAKKLGERWQVGTLESTDEGKTWGSYRQIAYDPAAGCRADNGFNETDLMELPDHTVLAVLRQQRVGTHAGPCDHYAEPSDYFYRAVSHDLGKSWSAPERLELIGTSPCLHVTADGLLMFADRDSPQVPALETNYRESSQASTHYGLAIRLSRDQGRSWVDQFNLEDPHGVKFSAQQQPGSPDMVGLPDGKILVVFYSPQRRYGKLGFYLAANILARTDGVGTQR